MQSVDHGQLGYSLEAVQAAPELFAAAVGLHIDIVKVGVTQPGQIFIRAVEQTSSAPTEFSECSSSRIARLSLEFPYPFSCPELVILAQNDIAYGGNQYGKIDLTT